MRGMQKDLRTTGFVHGSQATPAETGIGEIRAVFEAEMCRIREAAVDAEKHAEAELLALEKARVLNEAEWEIHKERAGDKIPNRLIPLIFLVLTAAAAFADVGLLSPMVDAMGIPDPTHQVLIAISFVIVGGLLIEGLLALLNRTFNPDRTGAPETKLGMGLRFGAALVVFLAVSITLFTIGMWRAEVLKYGNESGWLANLLRACGPLTSTMIVAFNIGLALMTAFFSHWYEKLVFALAWHRAKRNLKAIPKLIAKAQKRVESIRKRLEHRLEALSKKRDKWVQAYLQHYGDGRTNGTVLFPMLGLWLKVGVTFLLVFIVLVYATMPVEDQLSDLVRWLTIVLGSTAIAGIVGYRAYMSRLFPSPRQIFRQRATHYGRQTVTDEFTREISLSLNATPAPVSDKALPSGESSVTSTSVRAVNGIHSN